VGWGTGPVSSCHTGEKAQGTLRERVFSHIPQHSQPIAIERKKGLLIARSLSLSPRHCIIKLLSRLPCSRLYLPAVRR
jgi:hypothetical protein